MSKLEPAPLSGKSYLSMGNNSLSNKQDAEKEALLAKHKAELAALEHKHTQELSKAGPQSIPRPKKITQKVRQIDMSKFD